MAKFHFRLATLLRLRETVRDERRLRIGRGRAGRRQLQARLVEVQREQRQLQGECRTAAGPGEVDLPRLVEAHQYAGALREQETELQQERRTLAVEIDRRRQAAVEADRDVQTLEKLRESQWQTHRQEEQRQEAKQLDEAASQTAGNVGNANDPSQR